MNKLRFFIFIMVLFVSSSYASDSRFGSSLMLEKARQGEVEAMCDLGLDYFYGKNTLKDPFKAKCWIKKAYDRGSRRAEKLWEQLELWKYSGKCEAAFDDEPFLKHVRGDVFTEPVTGTAFVFIPRGCFLMGCDTADKKCDKDERPVHKVCVDGFWIGKYEVTQKLWQRVMGGNPSRFYTDSSRPVENVSFDEIQTFIQLLNARTREKFSLPTESQWEYACRSGGKKINFPWGNDVYRPDANCGTCKSASFHGETAPVGSFAPNGLGICDMAGNVREWCRDVYGKNAYTGHPQENPVYDGKGVSRVVRGGSFADNTLKLRCTDRDKSIPGMKSDTTGFRLTVYRINK